MRRAITAGEVRIANPIVATRLMTVTAAARLMREHQVGSLPVVDRIEGGSLVVGMLTDHDIVSSVVAKEIDPHLVRVEDVMSTELLVVRDDEPALAVLAAMQGRGVRRAPVLDERRMLVGIVSLETLVGVVADELLAQGLALTGRQPSTG